MHRSSSVAQLELVLTGVRSGSNPPAAASGTSAQDSARPLPQVTADLPLHAVRAADRAVAVFGETKRLGPWTPARETSVAAVLGSVLLDLREARLGPGETVFRAVTFMGSVEIIAPFGLRLECNGSAVLGSFEENHPGDPHPARAQAPSVRIEGIAVLGSVEIEYRHPGESKKEARRRRKREKKERRRLARG